MLDAEEILDNPSLDLRTKLSELARLVESFRATVLLDDLYGMQDVDEHPLAEQHFLLALAALDQANRHFSLAALHIPSTEE